MTLELKAYCSYCHQEIDTLSDGWGGTGENVVFHLECFQMNEGVDV